MIAQTVSRTAFHLSLNHLLGYVNHRHVQPAFQVLCEVSQNECQRAWKTVCTTAHNLHTHNASRIMQINTYCCSCCWSCYRNYFVSHLTGLCFALYFPTRISVLQFYTFSSESLRLTISWTNSARKYVISSAYTLSNTQCKKTEPKTKTAVNVVKPKLNRKPQFFGKPNRSYYLLTAHS